MTMLALLPIIQVLVGIQQAPRPIICYLTPFEYEAQIIKYKDKPITKQSVVEDDALSGVWSSTEESDFFISSNVLPVTDLTDYVATLKGLQSVNELGLIQPGAPSKMALDLISKTFIMKQVELPEAESCFRTDLSIGFRPADPTLKVDIFSVPERPVGIGFAKVQSYDMANAADRALFNDTRKSLKLLPKLSPSEFQVFERNLVGSESKAIQYGAMAEFYAKECEGFQLMLAEVRSNYDNLRSTLLSRLYPELIGKDLTNMSLDDLPQSIRDSLIESLAKQFGNDPKNPALAEYLKTNPKFNIVPIVGLSMYANKNGQNTSMGIDLPTGK